MFPHISSKFVNSERMVSMTSRNSFAFWHRFSWSHFHFLDSIAQWSKKSRLTSEGNWIARKFIANHPGGKDKIMLAAGKAIDPFWHLSLKTVSFCWFRHISPIQLHHVAHFSDRSCQFSDVTFQIEENLPAAHRQRQCCGTVGKYENRWFVCPFLRLAGYVFVCCVFAVFALWHWTVWSYFPFCQGSPCGRWWERCRLMFGCLGRLEKWTWNFRAKSEKGVRIV